MALVFADLVQESTSTTGTGTLTLTGATTGNQTFAAIGNANTTYYRIKSGTSNEVGIGTYTLSGTTLSRDTVLYSTAGGTTKITVGADAVVSCVYPAEKIVILDASNNATPLGAATGTSFTASAAVTGSVVSATNGILINNKTIGATYTLPSGYNGSSVGPVTLSSGVVVTVPTGQRWVVL